VRQFADFHSYLPGCGACLAIQVSMLSVVRQAGFFSARVAYLGQLQRSLHFCLA